MHLNAIVHHSRVLVNYLSHIRDNTIPVEFKTCNIATSNTLKLYKISISQIWWDDSLPSHTKYDNSWLSNIIFIKHVRNLTKW